MRRRSMARCGAVTLLLASLLPFPAVEAAQIVKCVGPAGELKFTDRECPEGYRREAEAAGRQPPEETGEEPYVCRFSDYLSPFEIDAALIEAEQALSEAGRKGDEGRRALWEGCLSRLRERQRSLAAGRPDSGGAPAVEPKEETPSDPFCGRGSFETEHVNETLFHVYFTNVSDRACDEVDYVCTYEMMVTGGAVYTYTESQSLQYRGRIRAGKRVRLGSVGPRSGPVSRELRWSRCRFTNR